MGREYALRVEEDNEHLMREIVAQVDARMKAFHQAHPDQSKLTTAVIIALALAEELHATRRQHNRECEETTGALDALTHRLIEALPPGEQVANGST